MKNFSLIVNIFSSLCLALGFFSIFYSNHKILKANEKLKKYLTEDLLRLDILVNLLQTQCFNPIIYEICEQIRHTKFEDIPKNGKEFATLFRKATKIFHDRVWGDLQEKLKNAKEPGEKEFIEKRISKISEVMTLLDSIDESSSGDFVKIIAREIQKTLMEDIEDMRNGYE